LPGGRFSLEPTVTDAEILTLVRKLEQCQLSPREFHHRDHLAVSVFYLSASDLETALAAMRSALKKLIAHYGLKGYHETITRFWMLEVERHLNRELCLAKSVAQIQAELGDKNLIYKYYSKDVLNSPQAKEGWIEPDLVRADREM
jgi:hypothetical protein